MDNEKFKQVDFDHPSFGFILEDKLKSILGGPLLYNPYYRTFKLKGSENVLDFGCGGGVGSRYILKLLNNNGHLTCVDLSKYWIKKAKKRLGRYPNAKCIQGDIRKLDISDSSFDIISIIHVIHDIEPTKREETIKALSRKLKYGGAIFIREPIKPSHGMPVDEIRAHMSSAGLKEIEHKIVKSEYIGKFIKYEYRISKS